MKPERQWWHRLGTLTLTIVSAVGLFKAAGFLDLRAAPLASWVIFFVCVYGLGQIYDVIFDIVVAIVDAKRRQLARRRGVRVV
jgi:hypothetical protein